MHAVLMVPVYLPTHMMFVQHDIRIIQVVFAEDHERIIIHVKGHQSPEWEGKPQRLSNETQESSAFTDGCVRNSFRFFFSSELQIYEVFRAELAISEHGKHN